jgi:hypothetical protein
MELSMKVLIDHWRLRSQQEFEVQLALSLV